SRRSRTTRYSTSRTRSGSGAGKCLPTRFRRTELTSRRCAWSCAEASPTTWPTCSSTTSCASSRVSNSSPLPCTTRRPERRAPTEHNMGRWLAYSGTPITIESFLFKPEHSLIDQSLHSTMGAETTNGDGFGVGWYGVGETPGVFHSTEPAWNDRNLRELAAHVEAPILFAHVRASSGSPVPQTNCHPFRHGRWLWMPDGAIRELPAVKRMPI